MKEIKKIIQNIKSDDRDLEQLKRSLDTDDFMPLVTSKENSAIPYQIHDMELEKIIENQGQYYPFLLEKSKNNNYRIQEILKFRIPYYVGPLNNTTKEKEKKNKNAWACKKSNEIITPFNFDEVIDIDESASEFIEHMTSYCTYLLKEKVLPNESILYSKFKVWNELKQIKVNGKALSHEIQKKIMINLFEKKGTVTEKDLINFLKQSGEYDMEEELEITGYSAEKKFANNMQSYIDFFGANGIFDGTNYKIEDAEQIIKWITVFEDKKILERKILQNYPDLKEKLTQIKSKKYQGWGKLSKKFLTEIYFENEMGESKSIMDLMEETPYNLMQIYNSTKYGFEKKVNEINNQNQKQYLSYDLVSNLVTSPSTKKGIYQALLIIDEIIRLMGYKPKNISIEMARGEGIKGRTQNRKKQFEKIYKDYKTEIERNCEYLKITEELENQESLDPEKLYLYFIQEGKSLYSGEPIDIERLNKYEVDHIIPRSLIKDNSLDNKALVTKQENQDKGASFILPKEYRNQKNKEWWKHLLKVGLISQKKYYNLCRKEYTEEDIKGFIKRQLVETRQICKHVANIVGNLYEDVKVVYLHADLSHNYREKFELFKFRQINNFHHAQDAYLAAVLGNYKEYHLKEITSTNQLHEMRRFIPDEEERKKRLRFGYVINSLDQAFQLYDEETGEMLFDINAFNKTIEETLYQNDVIINRKTEIKSGQFYKDSKNKKNAKVKNAISLKGNLEVEKYGSYSGIECSFMVLVTFTKGNKQHQKLLGMPVMYKEDFKKHSEIVLNYFRKKLKLKETDTCEIISKPIPFNTLIKWNEKLCYITGASMELQNATELKIEKENMKKWKHILNRLLNNKTNDELEDEQYEKELEILYKYLLEKIKYHYKLFENELEKLQNITFSTFSLDEKEYILKQIFRMLSCNGENANLQKIHLGDRFGRKSNQNIKNATVITKSITGIKEKCYEF